MKTSENSIETFLLFFFLLFFFCQRKLRNGVCLEHFRKRKSFFFFLSLPYLSRQCVKSNLNGTKEKKKKQRKKQKRSIEQEV